MDGRTVTVGEGVPWNKLKKVYNEIDEQTNPSLKERIYRELLRRKNGQPIPASEKINPPSWRLPEGEAVVLRNERDVPEGWGQSPQDVFLDLDQPSVVLGPGLSEMHPRWRQGPVFEDGELYPANTRTWRIELAEIARSLVERIESDRRIPGPSTEPHPGWGRAHIREGETAEAELQSLADYLNGHYGPQSAEVVYKTGRAAGIRLNRELEAHLAGGGRGEYNGWDPKRNENLARLDENTARMVLKITLRRLGLGDTPSAVAMPSGRVQMYTADELARELLETARSGQAATPSAPEILGRRNAWLEELAHNEALAEDAARTKNAATGAGGQPGERNPRVELVEAIGEPLVNKKGQTIPGVRLLLGKPFKVRMNKLGDAVELGAPNSALAEPQLRDMLTKADKMGVAVERTINDVPDKKGHIKLLKDLGFVVHRNESGALVLRREPRIPGMVTPEQAATMPTATPAVKARVVNRKPAAVLENSGNVKPGNPAVRPADKPFDPYDMSF
jgi:hypothetical protein